MLYPLRSASTSSSADEDVEAERRGYNTNTRLDDEEGLKAWPDDKEGQAGQHEVEDKSR